MSYQGYSNFETFSVSCWIGSDAEQHGYWTARAVYRAEATEVLTMEEATRFEFADAMKEEINELAENAINDAKPRTGAALACCMLKAALERVNWQEIADDYLHENEPGRFEAGRPTERGER